jgi:hypothetical protein
MTIAVFVGPIVSILIAHSLTKRHFTFQTKLRLLDLLHNHKWQTVHNPASRDCMVDILNQIPIVFHDSKAVIQRFREYHQLVTTYEKPDEKKWNHALDALHTAMQHDLGFRPNSKEKYQTLFTPIVPSDLDFLSKSKNAP